MKRFIFNKKLERMKQFASNIGYLCLNTDYPAMLEFKADMRNITKLGLL